ncbi:MAG TPA: cell wall hydrolase [Allosphingosinicella sp.]|nr:cell wall hydrolase [Allosphingosinicella sp.]
MLALGMLALSASCVPVGTAARPAHAGLTLALPPLETIQPPPAPESVMRPSLPAAKAAALNAAIPFAAVANPAARSAVFRASTPLDQMRALDCLTQAVYYEAASESEAGQRAVAQVVLNRVRHPAYPNSVCGVVYQGPMRAGGGCQFTFTCDGALARRPSAVGWSRARRIAAEALAGKVFAPVGHATHYHTFAVLPHWASSLAKTAVIGAHIFYRWGNGWGEPAAFHARYAGAEPLPRPAAVRASFAGGPRLPVPGAASYQPLLPVPSAGILAAADPVTAPAREDALPESTIRPEYRNSGRPREVPLD